MNPDSPNLEHIWTVRRVRPAMAIYVAGVFLAFMAMASFVFKSMDAVKALASAAVAAVLALVPGIRARVDYRLTDRGVGKRAHAPGSPGEFEELFSWDELSHVIPTRTGFRFYKAMDSSNPLGRFMNRRILAGRSGEFPVQGRDLEVVRTILQKKNISMSEPPARSGFEANSGM